MRKDIGLELIYQETYNEADPTHWYRKQILDKFGIPWHEPPWKHRKYISKALSGWTTQEYEAVLESCRTAKLALEIVEAIRKP